MARPTKYNKVIIEKIVEALKSGSSRMAAAEYVGIAYETFRDWKNSREEFHCLVTQSEAEAEMMFTKSITDAAKGTVEKPGDWRAAAWWLARRRRAEWGEKLDISKLDDETILRILAHEEGSALELSSISDEDLLAEARRRITPIQIKHTPEELRNLSPDELYRIHRQTLGD